MGTNRKPRPNTCTTRSRLADRKADIQVEMLGGVVHGKGKRQPAKGDDVARLNLGAERPTTGIRNSSIRPPPESTRPADSAV